MLIAKENKGVIVCSNPEAMLAKSHGYGIAGIDFMSYYEFLHTKHDEKINYYIDELEMLMKYITWESNPNAILDGYTLSEDD